MNKLPGLHWHQRYNERSKHDTFPVVIPLDERGARSKWVTLRALLVLKRWYSAQ